MVRVSHLHDGRLVRFDVDGKPSPEDFIATFEEHYADVRKAVLWDLSRAEVAHISSVDMKRIARKSAALTRHERTAFVGAEDLQFGLLRMYEAHAATQDVPAQMQAFRSEDEALAWLREIL